jgi:hypothetical protein
VINIESIQVVLSILGSDEWEFLDYISYDAKIGYLKNFTRDRILELVDAFSTKDASSSSYSDRVLLKILDNLHVNFKNIHIRIEEPIKVPFYSFGITLEEMLVVNTNENWEQKFIDRNKNKNINVFKLLKISNCGIYFNSNENKFLSTNKANILEEMDKIFKLGSAYANDIDYLIKPSHNFLIFSILDSKNETK